MFSSVKAGLSFVRAEGRSTHVAVSPADLPFLREESLRKVLNEAPSLGERTLAVPTHAGRRGHPLLFSSALIPRILGWPDDRRLSDLFEEPDLKILHLEGFGGDILRDVDRPQDLSFSFMDHPGKTP
jgi:molybdenum cofactor cytidylyltransferase